MTDVDEHGRAEPPLAADEAGTLLGFLDYQRATFAWKCAGLDAAGLAATVGVSAMTLGGMLKHLALVEDSWFSEWLLGRDPAPPWDTVDWDADRDWEWHTVAADSPEQLRGLWQDNVARARACVSEALASGGLDQLAGRQVTEPALDHLPHDRGVRAAQRPRRPHPGVGGRGDRRIGRGPAPPRKRADN